MEQVAQRDSEISIPGSFQDLADKSPEQPGLILQQVGIESTRMPSSCNYPVTILVNHLTRQYSVIFWAMLTDSVSDSP